LPALTANHEANDFLRDYFYSVFPAQLKQLSYSRPSHIAGAALGVENVPFFGGPEWKNVASDLGGIPPSDRARFVLALFTIVLTDQALYTNSCDDHARWRRQTAFPKFGWTGFGIHNENPFKLLWAPEREGLVDAEELIAAMPDSVDFLVEETARVIAAYGLTVSPATHFTDVVHDAAYRFNEGTIVPAFKAAFEKKLNPAQAS
jgi:hypothetical protein